MNNLKYKVGDKVRIKSLDWYNENRSKSHGTVACGGKYFEYDMREWCGKTLTIQSIGLDFYIMEEDNLGYEFTDEMIEGLAEEETKSIDFTIKATDTKGKVEVVIPEGYGYVVENDKLYFITKKKEYPKTYEECCEVLDFCGDYFLTTYDADCMVKKEVYGILQQVNSLTRLLICKSAYWKIAGEEMGLGKPWEPDWDDDEWPDMYYISFDGKRLEKEKGYPCCNMILIFPTEEMRDAFYENFKELIESVKELL